MSPGLKSVRTPDTVRPIPSAQILPVDIERIATVRTVANFFMIYLFFLFWNQVNCWKMTRLPHAALRKDRRAYESLKKSKLVERQGKQRKRTEDKVVISTGGCRVASCSIRRNLQSMKMLTGTYLVRHPPEFRCCRRPPTGH